MNNKTLVMVVGHEGCHEKMQQWCFNEHFAANRNQIELMVVLNGFNQETIDFVKNSQNPEYLLVRENSGADPAMFNYGIMSIEKSYETVILIHYDHWFDDSNWLEYITTYLYNNPYDVIGNIVYNDSYPVSSYIKEKAYNIKVYNRFLQGNAGIYKWSVIDTIKNNGGIYHPIEAGREGYVKAAPYERIHSFRLLDKGVRFGQIPPGYEKYLRHANF